MFTKDNVFLDYLVVRLVPSKIDSRLFSLVENSPYLDTTEIFWFKSYLWFDWNYTTHRIYYIYDWKNNKVAQIMIVTPENKRSDFYDKISFYGLFFNFYLNDDFSFTHILGNIFGFFSIDDNSPLTRFDIKTDVDFIPRFNWIYLNSRNTKQQGWTWFCYSNKYKNTSASYEFRIYDKRLDIVDNLFRIEHNDGTFPYNEIRIKKSLLRRIEIQYNSKKIKEKWISLYALFDREFLYSELNNYCIQFLDSFSGSKKYYKSDKKLQKKSFKREVVSYKHTVDMFKIYLEKLKFLDRTELLKIIKSKTTLLSEVWYNDLVNHESIIYSLKNQVTELEQQLLEYQKKYWYLNKKEK